MIGILATSWYSPTYLVMGPGYYQPNYGYGYNEYYGGGQMQYGGGNEQMFVNNNNYNPNTDSAAGNFQTTNAEMTQFNTGNNNNDDNHDIGNFGGDDGGGDFGNDGGSF